VEGIYNPYKATSVYLRIKKRGSLFTLSYKQERSEPKPLLSNHNFDLADVELYIFVLSTSRDTGIEAQFSEFTICRGTKILNDSSDSKEKCSEEAPG
jgi:hypothetical protein